MSTGPLIPLAEARTHAEQLRSLLAPACDRIEIAGSIRRQRAEVRDIELVAIPRISKEAATDLWGTPIDFDHLEASIELRITGGVLRARPVESHRTDGSVDVGERMGQAYKALEYAGLPVDLFIVRPPAQWGVIFAIRTGPGDWNQRLVTDCQRYLRRVAGGQVYRSGQAVPCPEESDFFRALGQPWVEPEQRAPDRVAISAGPSR